jgi:predicted deacetylase
MGSRIFVKHRRTHEIVELMKGRGHRHPKWVYRQMGLKSEEDIQCVIRFVDEPVAKKSRKDMDVLEALLEEAGGEYDSIGVLVIREEVPSA